MSAWAIALSASLLCVIGALLVYLASPHQQLLSRRPFPPALVGVGAAALLVALALFLGLSGPGAAVFIWVTLAMLVWSVLPLGVAWWRMREER